MQQTSTKALHLYLLVHLHRLQVEILSHKDFI